MNEEEEAFDLPLDEASEVYLIISVSEGNLSWSSMLPDAEEEEMEVEVWGMLSDAAFDLADDAFLDRLLDPCESIS